MNGTTEFDMFADIKRAEAIREIINQVDVSGWAVSGVAHTKEIDRDLLDKLGQQIKGLAHDLRELLDY